MPENRHGGYPLCVFFLCPLPHLVMPRFFVSLSESRGPNDTKNNRPGRAWYQLPFVGGTSLLARKKRVDDRASDTRDLEDDERG